MEEKIKRIKELVALQMGDQFRGEMCLELMGLVADVVAGVSSQAAPPEKLDKDIARDEAVDKLRAQVKVLKEDIAGLRVDFIKLTAPKAETASPKEAAPDWLNPMANLSISATSIRRGLGKIERATQRAQVTAFNRTATAVQRAAAREIGQEIAVTQRAVMKTLFIRRASAGKPNAQVGATGKRIPLIEFKARQTRRGVSYRIGSRAKILASGFLARMRSSHRGVFLRRGKARLPIRELFGPSTVLIFTRKKVQRVLRAVIGERFAKEFAHNLRFFNRGTG